MVRILVVLLLTCALSAQDLNREYLNEFDHAVKQTVQLAEAIPAEKYSWRPADGVRSVSEVMMHIATGNHLLLGVIGVKPPETLYPSGRADIKTSQALEKSISEKARVVAALKASFDAVR